MAKKDKQDKKPKNTTEKKKHKASAALEQVFDPTGAGDSFAGGFIGYLASTGDLASIADGFSQINEQH